MGNTVAFCLSARRTEFDNLQRQALAATRHQNDDLPSDINFEWRYTHEVTGVNKRAREDPERVNAAVQYRIELIEARDNLDLDKPADRLTASANVFAEDPRLYKCYTAANSVHIGKVSLPD